MRAVRIPTSNSADTAKEIASAISVQPEPKTATSVPAIAAPTIVAELVEMRSSAFADCSCSAGTTSGIRPVDAG